MVGLCTKNFFMACGFDSFVIHFVSPVSAFDPSRHVRRFSRRVERVVLAIGRSMRRKIAPTPLSISKNANPGSWPPRIPPAHPDISLPSEVVSQNRTTHCQPADVMAVAVVSDFVLRQSQCGLARPHDFEMVVIQSGMIKRGVAASPVQGADLNRHVFGGLRGGCRTATVSAGLTGHEHRRRL